MTQRKKIMFIDEHKIVNYAGGAEKVICSFANEFLNRDFDSCIVCMDMEEGQPLYPLDKRVHFINLCYMSGEAAFGGIIWFWKKLQKELLRTFAGSKMQICGHKIKDPKQSYYFHEFIRRLRKCIKKEQPDLLISISVDGAWLAQQAMGNSIPVIAMCHTDPEHFGGSFTEVQLEAWRNCAYVQVLMNTFKEDLERLGIRNVIRIPNGVEQTAEDNICDLTKCHHKIITVGRIDGSAKRQHLLIEAFALIADQYPNWNVHIYGNIANRRYKKHLDQLIIKYKLERRVIFEGVTRNVLQCLQNADIFAFPSEYEGFSLAMTEAMSAGLPVIGCKDCASVAELITNDCNGCLSEPVPEIFAKTLCYLMEHQIRREAIGREAHEAMKEYAPQRIWDEWEKYIRLVLS